MKRLSKVFISYSLVRTMQNLVSVNMEPRLNRQFPQSTLTIAKMNSVGDLLRYHGYEAETYRITTSDGYILTLDRLPKPGCHPILIVHGLQASAFTWVMMGPRYGLPYLLHDYGYDVWLANCRGTKFSRKHINLNPDHDKEFWNFSWHEIGVIDIPTTIDYILEQTKAKKISYIGHSQGCTAYFVLMSMKPEYNDKIAVMHAITPAVYLTHARTPLLAFLGLCFQLFRYPFNQEFNIQSEFYRHACLSSKILLTAILSLLERFFGQDFRNFNMNQLPILIYNFPVGCSVRQMAHYYQVYRTGIFAPFDNAYWTGSMDSRPEAYPLYKICTPIALYYCKYDYLIGVEDVQKLANELPNVIEDFLIPMNNWNHITPLIGTDVRKVLYSHIMYIQNIFTK